MSDDKKGEPSWLPARERDVLQAAEKNDVDALARLSALPGGFGSDAMRRRAWYALLGIEPPGLYEKTPKSEECIEHPDEHQVLLDTRRSFVTFPKHLPAEKKKAMQTDLQRAIVTVLRRHPRLRYFQGFHDIVTVLYLTLLDAVPVPTEATPHDEAQWDALLRCAEAVSLCRVRDGMGAGLEPMMGLLKILRRVLRLTDPQLYEISATISPVPTLPFFALSWILTLFSHDVDGLEPIQRIFDYLVARNPIAAIYLAVAVSWASRSLRRS
ncbi:GTPase-activating protein gyp8 [Cryptotrichosporon argae]